MKAIEVPVIETTCEKVVRELPTRLSVEALVMSYPYASKFAHVIVFLDGSLTLMLTLFDENLRPTGFLKLKYSWITCVFSQYLCLAVNVIGWVNSFVTVLA